MAEVNIEQLLLDIDSIGNIIATDRQTDRQPQTLDEKIENMEETLDSDVSTEETSNNHISEEKDSNEVSSAERKANEVLKSMSEEDRETVTDIITENMTPSTINEVSEYIESKDKEGLMNYAKENLSDEDYEKLQELYKKYSENGQIDRAAIEQE